MRRVKPPRADCLETATACLTALTVVAAETDASIEHRSLDLRARLPLELSAVLSHDIFVEKGHRQCSARWILAARPVTRKLFLQGSLERHVASAYLDSSSVEPEISRFFYEVYAGK